MTKGGPQNASMTTMVHAVRRDGDKLKVGYASAISIVFLLDRPAGFDNATSISCEKKGGGIDDDRLTNTTLLVTGYRSCAKDCDTGLNYLVMMLLAIFFLFPIVFMLVSSFKNNETQVLTDMSTLYAFLPSRELGLQNY